MKRGQLGIPQMYIGILVLLFAFCIYTVLNAVLGSLTYASDNQIEATLTKGVPLILMLVVLGATAYSIQRGM